MFYHLSYSPGFTSITKSWYDYSYIIVLSRSAAQRGLWPPRSRDFVITQNDAPQSLGLLRTSDQLVAETSN
jgi:hypothetical protein